MSAGCSNTHSTCQVIRRLLFSYAIPSSAPHNRGASTFGSSSDALMYLSMPVTGVRCSFTEPLTPLRSKVPALLMRMCRGSLRAEKSFTKLRILSNWATSRCRGVTLLVPRCSLIASAALQSQVTESVRSHIYTSCKL